jgi:hypothetical protein
MSICYMSLIMLPCLFHVSMSVPNFHGPAACPCPAVCPCPYCMSLSMVHIHVHNACPCPCPCCLSMSMSKLYVKVHAVYPCQCCMSMSMAMVCVHVRAAYLCRMSMVHRHGCVCFALLCCSVSLCFLFVWHLKQAPRFRTKAKVLSFVSLSFATVENEDSSYIHVIHFYFAYICFAMFFSSAHFSLAFYLLRLSFLFHIHFVCKNYSY